MNRKELNAQQSDLRRTMLESDRHEEVIKGFLQQHALLHSAKMANLGLWSYEDTILDDMTDAQMRRIPQNREHSVLWCIWHIARIEDLTMNLLVANTEQVFDEGNWLVKTDASIFHTANAMSMDEISEFSAAVNIAALRNYRIAVGRRTREIVQGLKRENLKEKVRAERLQIVTEKGLVSKNAPGIIDYWSKRDIAGLLLMPATRHNLVHLNEAAQLKAKRS
ncbi:MAG: DinB family protein [Chloroflexi bacterium]|nr:DinB family protein [Chloroflexota bacterium]